ncbi:hypothetical protein BDW74DRAFT_152933 [Aspergillus multicolor]|uniref:uncharacterized protein n=1 Tax=Aspergillus multicolor TaxID=41759 RepID=UPI003CCDF986
MKLSLIALSLLAVFSPLVAGQATGRVRFYTLGPQTEVAIYPDCTESPVTSSAPSIAVEILPYNSGDNVQCTFYEESECAGAEFTYGPGYHELDDEPLIPSFSCELIQDTSVWLDL